MAVLGLRLRRKERKKRKPTPKWLKVVKICLWVFLTLLCVSGTASIYLLQRLTNELEGRMPKFDQFAMDTIREPTTILSADGIEIYRLTNEHRKPVSYADLPQLVIDATVAAEDQRFWEHRGVDLRAISRAVWVNLTSGKKQGGSTITQQIAKRLLTSGERTFKRKIEDACLAILIEKHYTKEQIITLYLNQIYYGCGAYGIKAAASTYFGKPIDKLTTAEAALLARLPRRPSSNPYNNPKAATENRDIVLAIMRDQKMVSSEQYTTAKSEPLKLGGKPMAQTGILHAPYFVTYVLDTMRDEFPDEDFSRGGYKIYTTIRMDAQKLAEDSMASTLSKWRRRNVTEGALMVADRTGKILAMIGGSSFKRSQYNAITQGHRQPGSSFKPFIYSAALEMGIIKPTSTISNDQIVIQTGGRPYIPKGGGKGGRVSLQTAIVKSINMCALHTIMDVGYDQAANFVYSVFGFKTRLDPVPSLALGATAVSPMEMAEGYSVFATRGNRVKMYGITRVEGPTGSVVRRFDSTVIQNVLSEATVEPMHDILQRAVLQGTGHRASGVLNAGGKTGTTDLNKDAWFCGFTDELVAVSWVTNATYDPKSKPPWRYARMNGVMGGDAACEMWAGAVKGIQKLVGEQRNKRAPKSFGGYDDSENVHVLICLGTGDLAIPGSCPKTQTKTMMRKEAKELLPCGLHGGMDKVPPEIPDFEPNPADKPPPDLPPTPPPVVNERDLTEVEICVESGMRATQYCPVKRTESFQKGKEPRGTCKIHTPHLH